MKRLSCVLLCIVMLAALFGCSLGETPPVEPTPTQTGTPAPGGTGSIVTPSPAPTTTPAPVVDPSPEPEPEPAPEPDPVVPGPADAPSGGLVTQDTLPSDPEEFYLVGQLPEENIFLYARNHGAQTMLVWEGNFRQIYDHTAHTENLVLPRLTMLEGGYLAVVSQVQSGPGVSVEELIVYDMNADAPDETGLVTQLFDPHYYEWKELAAEFNRTNSMVYHKTDNSISINSISIAHGGNVLNTGSIANRLDYYLGLENEFLGILIADGEQVRYSFNEDGTVAITLGLALADSSGGVWSEEDCFWDSTAERYYPEAKTGLSLTWNVRFHDGGFSIDQDSITLSSETGFSQNPYLQQREVLRSGDTIHRTRMGHYYLLSGHQFYSLGSLGDGITGAWIYDPDGDTQAEIVITSFFAAGGGITEFLTVLEREDGAWVPYYVIHTDYRPPYGDYASQAATFDADGNHVTMHLEGLDYRFTVSDEAAALSGEYYPSSYTNTRTIFRSGEHGLLYLRFAGQVYKHSGFEHDIGQSLGVSYELLYRIDYLGDGQFAQVPVALCGGQPGVFFYCPPMMRFDYTGYMEDELTILSLLSEPMDEHTGAMLYRDGEGKILLRWDGHIAPIPEQYQNSPYGYTLLSAKAASGSAGEAAYEGVNIMFNLSETAQCFISLTWSEEGNGWIGRQIYPSPADDFPQT